MRFARDKGDMRLDGRCSLTGKVALITGGSSGIGLSIAEALAKEGAETVIVGCDIRKLNCAAERLATAARGKIRSLSVDVSDASSHAELVNEVMRVAGRLDILVNAAGAHFKRPSL